MARARTEPVPEPAAEEPEAAPDAVDAAEPLTIVQALSAVMGDVQSVSKTGRNTSQNYNFRGIDAVVNAVGPALRKHGVVVVPWAVDGDSEQYQTKSGTAMKNVTLTVTFRFYGPTGDHLDATARGEAADSGDKATPKAHSVAFRTMLLQALCIPTDEPDPDSQSHERVVHESGFKGGKADDAAPQPGRQTAPAYDSPKGWRELRDRMGNLIGEDESREWMAQAKELITGEHELSVSELPEAQQREVWDVLTKVLRSLDTETEGDLRIHPTPRETIAAQFAKHLDGQIIAGPRWALSGDEAERDYPAKADVLAETSGDLTPEPTEDGSAEDGYDPAAEPSEESVADAEADREAFRDGSSYGE